MSRHDEAGVAHLVGVVVVLALLVLLVVVLARHSDTTASAPAPTSTTAARVHVPDVVGLDYASARSRLALFGLTAARTGTSGDLEGTVVAQQPLAGADVADGSTVRLTVLP